jgi:hypothetical protein
MAISFDFDDLKLPDTPPESLPPSPPERLPPTPLPMSRIIGGLILVGSCLLVFLFSVNLDNTVFIPYNRNVQATQTAGATPKASTETPRLPRNHPPINPTQSISPIRVPPKTVRTIP